MNKAREVERQYKPQEVAELLGVHRTTVWRLIDSGDLSPVAVLGPRSTRIPASTVNKYLSSRQVER